MPAKFQKVRSAHSPESLVDLLSDEPGVVLLRTGMADADRGCVSFVTARPMITLRSSGSRCELTSLNGCTVRNENPWNVLAELLCRFEQHAESETILPAGGCFGYWGYDLRTFVEPVLQRKAVNDLGFPDCHLGFYDSVVAFDHRSDEIYVISSGLNSDGSRSGEKAEERYDFWERLLRSEPQDAPCSPAHNVVTGETRAESNLSRADFIRLAREVQQSLRSGEISQVNLSHRLSAPCPLSGLELFHRLSRVSPAPYAAYLDCGDFQLVSSSPELFLRINDRHICTRPIKGTRPRAEDVDLDNRFEQELKTSPKEKAELVMITDLLRNDVGRVCEYGSIRVPKLFEVERYAHVRHLVSTVEGQLRADVTHCSALAACFPGGSITGAPKIQAMKIIDELEPVSRGPYTGAL